MPTRRRRIRPHYANERPDLYEWDVLKRYNAAITKSEIAFGKGLYDEAKRWALVAALQCKKALDEENAAAEGSQYLPDATSLQKQE